MFVDKEVNCILHLDPTLWGYLLTRYHTLVPFDHFDCGFLGPLVCHVSSPFGMRMRLQR